VTLRLVLLLGLALAACSRPIGDGPEAQCERQAETDPAVREVYLRSTVTAYSKGSPEYNEVLAVKRQVVLKCMRQKGLVAPGGVQPVQAPWQ
jgi:hypothetical protein